MDVPERVWQNPLAGKQARRLTPIAIDGILRAHDAGCTNGEISRAYGVSKPTVTRVLARVTPQVRQAIDDLSELADAERELRDTATDLGYSSPHIERVIEVIRYGHLVRRNLERADGHA
jgi:DNA-binding MarR family transcriptional regulator